MKFRSFIYAISGIIVIIITFCLLQPLNTGAVYYSFPDAALVSGEIVTYKVKSGDTLWSIARKYATTVDELYRLNNMKTTLIIPGMTLVVSKPAAAEEKIYIEYIVRRGDTLGIIAEAFGTNVQFIRTLNGINGDIIYIGQKLKVPAEYFEYQVVSGDTLWQLGQRFGVPYGKIMVYSSIEFTDLRVGQILKIPGKPTAAPPSAAPAPSVPTKTYFVYTVERGDNVWSIAVKFGIPMQEVLSDNGLSTESTLNLGQKLRIAKYTIPVKSTPGAKYGEYLDWWTEAQYVVPINKVFIVKDFETQKSFTIKRTVGAAHADCEPLTAADTAAAKSVFGGFTWNPRAVIVEVDGRRLAASMSFYPHDVQYINDNSFNGHFDLYFANCVRHSDGKPDANHQKMVEKSAGR